jgi:hypothetical protein
LAFLRRDPRFEAIWASYRPIGQIGPVRAFERTLALPPS